jgi:hypothetical protein
MSRDILTGDYRIDSPSSVGEVRIIPKEQIGGLVYVESDGLPWQSTVTMYGTIVLMLLLFGYDIFRSMRKSSALLLGPRTRCSFPNDLPMASFLRSRCLWLRFYIREGKPFPSYSHLQDSQQTQTIGANMSDQTGNTSPAKVMDDPETPLTPLAQRIRSYFHCR